MKKIFIFISLSFLLVVLTACNDGIELEDLQGTWTRIFFGK